MVQGRVVSPHSNTILARVRDVSVHNSSTSLYLTLVGAPLLFFKVLTGFPSCVTSVWPEDRSGLRTGTASRPPPRRVSHLVDGIGGRFPSFPCHAGVLKHLYSQCSGQYRRFIRYLLSPRVKRLSGRPKSQKKDRLPSSEDTSGSASPSPSRQSPRRLGGRARQGSRPDQPTGAKRAPPFFVGGALFDKAHPTGVGWGNFRGFLGIPADRISPPRSRGAFLFRAL